MAKIEVQVSEETMIDFEFICNETGATPEQVLRFTLDQMYEMVRRGVGVDPLYEMVEEEGA